MNGQNLTAKNKNEVIAEWHPVEAQYAACLPSGVWIYSSDGNTWYSDALYERAAVGAEFTATSIRLAGGPQDQAIVA